MSDDRGVTAEQTASRVEQPDQPKCGIIMPISGTETHSAAHWSAVREVIGRAVIRSGHAPAPVWENSSNDRVSARIIGNIFAFPLAVVDISGSNPNVMLEFGLRLASKKPTVVVVEEGGYIPFDIRDFHYIEYPRSLIILEMEQFIDDLADNLSAKVAAANADGYSPFLANVVVDVVTPGIREVPVDRYVLNRLNEISSQIEKLNRASFRDIDFSSSLARTIRKGLSRSTHYTTSLGTVVFFSLETHMTTSLMRAIRSLGVAMDLKELGSEAIAGTQKRYFAVISPNATTPESGEIFFQDISGVIGGHSGEMGVPHEVANTAAIF